MSSDARRKIAAFLPPVILAALALFYLSQEKGFNDPTSGQAPSLYGHAMLVLCAIVLAMAFVRSRTQPRKEAANDGGLLKTLVIFAILGFFIALIFLIGFYAAIPVFLLLFLTFVAQLRLWLSSLWALAASAAVWGIFGQLLHMRVFTGYLF